MAGAAGGPSVGRMINDQAPTPLPASGTPVHDAAPSVTGSETGSETGSGTGSGTASTVGRIVVSLLVLAFAGVTGLFAPLLVMASDSCTEEDARTICSASAQQIVGGLPVGAAFVAALLAVVGMGSRGTVGWGCLLAAPCLLVLSWVVSLGIVGS